MNERPIPVAAYRVISVGLALGLCFGCSPLWKIDTPVIHRSPGGGLLNTIDNNIATVISKKHRGDADMKRGKYGYNMAFGDYCEGLVAAVRAHNWAQEYEIAKKWFGAELYIDLKTALLLIPELERKIESLVGNKAFDIPGYSVRNKKRLVAGCKIMANYPVTPEELRFSEEGEGVGWYEGLHGVKKPMLVTTWEEAWLALQERMRLLEEYLVDDGKPRPPSLHDIVRDLRKRGVISKEPKRLPIRPEEEREGYEPPKPKLRRGSL